MYLSDEKKDPFSLRQGDILKDIDLLGALNKNNILYTVQPGSASNDFWMYREKPETGYVMVLSHCCELDKKNGMKVTSIIVAPLRDINKASAPDKIKDIINTNIIDREHPQKSYLKYFYIPNSEQLPYKNGAVVDFSKIFSFKNSCYDYLLSNKILQLQDDYREHMSFKLGLFFYRTQLVA
ncbi:hypothetical protein AGMMS49940_14240 [Spirochaetia bacterium]|nr:hypothetical protein AGMMS49940_14240 [Spirochaetia bacterium]